MCRGKGVPMPPKSATACARLIFSAQSGNKNGA